MCIAEHRAEKPGSPRNLEGSGLSGIFRQGTEAVKAGVMEAKRTQLGWAQDPPRQRWCREGRGSWSGEEKRWGEGRGSRGQRSASLTVQVLFLGPHDLVGRGLAYCLGHGGAGDTVLGGGDSVRQALAGHLCGSSATPPARQPAGTGTPKRRRTPTPPTPTGSFSACRPGAGLRAARCHPAQKNRLLSPAGSGTISGTPLPPPQLSPPPPWSAEAGQGKRDRQLQENGGARLLLGAFRAAPGHVTRAPPLLLRLPPLFPSLSSSTQALPRSAREERGGARALRDGTRPAGATGGSPAGAVRGPPRHVMLPANRSPEAGLAGVTEGEGGGGARDVWLLPSPPTRVS